jgi:hypothetical protein
MFVKPRIRLLRVLVRGGKSSIGIQVATTMQNAHFYFYRPRIPLSIAYLSFLFRSPRKIVDGNTISSACILSSEHGAGIRSGKQSVKNVY